MTEEAGGSRKESRSESTTSNSAEKDAHPVPKRRSNHKRKRTLEPLDMTPPSSNPSSPLQEQIADNFILELDTKEQIQVYGRNLAQNKIREIGRGRYGTVDIMREPMSKLLMAVKRIRDSSDSQDPRYLEREVRACLEAKKCGFLVHCYGVMRLEGDIWICMELMETSIDQFYRTCVDMKRAIPESFLARIAYSVLTGLDYMVHHLKLMHRDVKPTNMLVGKEGNVKLCDYGISGQLESQPAEKTIQAGCKPYMAPERVDWDHPNYSKYDDRSDVWSLGISLLEIIQGVHPYEKWKSPFEQLNQVVKKDPPMLPSGHQCSDMLRTFVEFCLIKDFESRPRYKDLLESAFVQWYVREMERWTQLDRATAAVGSATVDARTPTEQGTTAEGWTIVQKPPGEEGADAAGIHAEIRSFVDVVLEKIHSLSQPFLNAPSGGSGGSGSGFLT